MAIIGIREVPGRRKYDGQKIVTRFFFIGLPLFPMGTSYKISENFGINIPTRIVDVLNGYAKFSFLVIGLIFLIAPLETRYIGWILLGISICFHLEDLISKDLERGHREIFRDAFDYNMLPEYLPKDLQEKLFSKLKAIYLMKFIDLDWEDKIISKSITPENRSLLYTLAYYKKTLISTDENRELFNNISNYFKTLESEQVANYYDESNSSTKQYSENEPNSNTKENSENTLSTTITLNELAELKQIRKDSRRLNRRISIIILIVEVVICLFTGAPLSAFLIITAIFGIIFLIVLLPGDIKISRDIKSEQKIKIKVKIEDVAEADGRTFIILKHNNYGVKKISAPEEFYSSDLLFKEIEVYVSKEAHILLSHH